MRRSRTVRREGGATRVSENVGDVRGAQEASPLDLWKRGGLIVRVYGDDWVYSEFQTQMTVSPASAIISPSQRSRGL